MPAPLLCFLDPSCLIGMNTSQLVIESLRIKDIANNNDFLKLVTVVEYLWLLLEALIWYLTSFFFEDIQVDES